MIAEKAQITLTSLEAVSNGGEVAMTLEEAGAFQLGLGGLLAITSGGVLRPSSVSGLVLVSAMDQARSTVSSVRQLGYEGALTLGIFDSSANVYTLHMLSFKNAGAYGAGDKLRYVVPPRVSALLSFFMAAVRPLLRPSDGHPFVFVKTNGGDAGRWFQSSRDGFGRLCGVNGLAVGVSIRIVRHIVSTAAVTQQLSLQERADIAAANLHTLDVVDRYYVAPTASAGVAHDNSTVVGNFNRGLGLCALQTCILISIMSRINCFNKYIDYFLRPFVMHFKCHWIIRGY